MTERAVQCSWLQVFYDVESTLEERRNHSEKTCACWANVKQDGSWVDVTSAYLPEVPWRNGYFLRDFEGHLGEWKLHNPLLKHLSDICDRVYLGYVVEGGFSLYGGQGNLPRIGDWVLPAQVTSARRLKWNTRSAEIWQLMDIYHHEMEAAHWLLNISRFYLAYQRDMITIVSRYAQL